LELLPLTLQIKRPRAHAEQFRGVIQAR
jgi:hypothetical protein